MRPQNTKRRRPSKPIRERVTATLKQLDQQRKDACEHLTSRRRQDGKPGWECIDCGVIR